MKRRYEDGAAGEGNNVPTPVTGTATPAAPPSNGSRRVVAVLQVRFVNCHKLFTRAACATTCIGM